MQIKSKVLVGQKWKTDAGNQVLITNVDKNKEVFDGVFLSGPPCGQKRQWGKYGNAQAAGCSDLSQLIYNPDVVRRTQLGHLMTEKNSQIQLEGLTLTEKDIKQIAAMLGCKPKKRPFDPDRLVFKKTDYAVQVCYRNHNGKLIPLLSVHPDGVTIYRDSTKVDFCDKEKGDSMGRIPIWVKAKNNEVVQIYTTTWDDYRG